MKRFITLTLVLALLLSVVSCGGTDSGGSFGNVDTYPEVNSENIRHSDSEVSSFIARKVTFLNKVYPDGNIPEDERDIYGGVAVVPIFDNPHFQAMAEGYYTAGDYTGLEEYMEYTGALLEMFEALEITGNLHNVSDRTPALELRYANYSAFANSDLPIIAKDDSGFFKGLYVYSYYYEECPNSYFVSDSYTASVKSVDMTDEKRELLNTLISSEYAIEALGEGETSRVIPSVKSLMHFYTGSDSEIISELGGCVLSEWTFYGVSKNAVMVDATDLDPDADSNTAYLILYLGATSGVRVEGIDLTAMKLDGKKLTLKLAITSTGDADLSGNPFVVVTINKSELDTEITKLAIRYSYE